MTSQANLVETSETASEFARELRENATDAKEFRDAVTEPITCNYSTVNNLLKTPQMRAAAEPNREQPPPSTQRTRPYANFVFNDDPIVFDQAGQSIAGITSALALPVISKKLLMYSPMGSFASILTKGSDNVITINAAGTYRIAINLALMFYPTGLEKNEDAANWSGVSNNLAQTPVQAYIALTQASKTYYELFNEIFLTKADLEKGRTRSLIGELTLTLAKNATFSVQLARGPIMGVMRKSGSTDKNEVLGLKKILYVAPSRNPQRDASNCIEIYRIS